MEKLQFKTNINCSGCVAKVTPHLEAVKEIKEWSVDTVNPSKILTVVVDGASAGEVSRAVEQAGFKIERV